MSESAEDKADYELRGILLNYFSNKSNAHIGFLLGVSLAFLGLSNQFILEKFHIKLIPLSIIFIISECYFLGRALYWSRLSTHLLIVKPYSIEELFKYSKIEQKKYEDGGFTANSLLLLQRATYDSILSKNKYEHQPLNFSHRIIIFFHSAELKYIVLFLIILLFAINYLFYNCILF